MRQRMIRPDFFASDSLANCSVRARLLFVGLWVYADDYGNLKYAPKRMIAQLFPYDDMGEHRLHELMAELEAVGCIKAWDDGETYVTVPNFGTYQKVNRPSKSNVPEPPEEVSKAKRTHVFAVENSVENVLKAVENPEFNEHSVSVHGALTLKKERKKEGKSYLYNSSPKEEGAPSARVEDAAAAPRHRTCGTALEWQPWTGSWHCPRCKVIPSKEHIEW